MVGLEAVLLVVTLSLLALALRRKLTIAAACLVIFCFSMLGALLTWGLIHAPDGSSFREFVCYLIGVCGGFLGLSLFMLVVSPHGYFVMSGVLVVAATLMYFEDLSYVWESAVQRETALIASLLVFGLAVYLEATEGVLRPRVRRFRRGVISRFASREPQR
ncbi:hypothetical protein BMI91_05285 [Thioclava sediminum]|uniref:DUF4203 domain-containing protein n=1 Tax=Thioclava sediminum TaxID=1915319 RepID=A0ABX3N1H4_9RHOB|nr:hypothetical protein BMI91_05285 [Thioclava sediminum]